MGGSLNLSNSSQIASCVVRLFRSINQLSMFGVPEPQKYVESLPFGLYLGVLGYGPPEVDRIWRIWGSYSNIPKAMSYLLKGDYNPKP